MTQAVDWAKVLAPETPLLEIVVRGSLTYLAIFLLLRVVQRRQSGSVDIADLLVIVLIADAAQNGMAGEYTSVSDGLLLVATIVGWSWLIDWLGYHVPLIERLVHPPPLRIIENGTIVWRNMRRELISREELMTHLREQGVAKVSDVREAFVEGDGRISVLTYETKQHAEEERRV